MRKIRFLPDTQNAIKALILTMVTIVLYVIGSVLPYKDSENGLSVLWQNPAQVIITLLISIAGIAIFYYSFSAYMKHGERGILNYLIILFGTYQILSFIGVIMNVLSMI